MKLPITCLVMLPACARRSPMSKAGSQPEGHRFKSYSAKRFNWHALRHYAVSRWIDAGLQPKTIQTFAGHATLAVTMDRYGHRINTGKRWTTSRGNSPVSSRNRQNAVKP